jgi:adenine-specific DNA methylase
MDRFEPRGVAGLRGLEEQRSDFWLKSVVEATFRQLFERISSGYLLFSYDNEGLLSREELLGLFGEFCTSVSFTEIKSGRFRTDVEDENRVYKMD